MKPILMLTIVLFSFYAQAEHIGPLLVPPECMGAENTVLCARLNAGDIGKIEVAGLCVTLTSERDDDIFIPMRSAEELKAFLEKAPSVGINTAPCCLPGRCST